PHSGNLLADFTGSKRRNSKSAVPRSLRLPLIFMSTPSLLWGGVFLFDGYLSKNNRFFDQNSVHINFSEDGCLFIYN
ncbi:MAG: hypothetical protein P8184_21565, partial [Calditrichia bacterium]